MAGPFAGTQAISRAKRTRKSTDFRGAQAKQRDFAFGKTALYGRPFQFHQRRAISRPNFRNDILDRASRPRETWPAMDRVPMSRRD
jgi:hypothetical protein